MPGGGPEGASPPPAPGQDPGDGEIRRPVPGQDRLAGVAGRIGPAEKAGHRLAQAFRQSGEMGQDLRRGHGLGREAKALAKGLPDEAGQFEIKGPVVEAAGLGLQAAKPGDDLYDAKVTVLAEQIRHHVKEEEHELFPEVKASGMDLMAVGEQLAAREQEIMGQIAGKA